MATPNSPNAAGVSLYATQGGGYATFVDGRYVWHELPDWAQDGSVGFVGDPIPEEWSVVSANAAARREVDTEEFEL